MTSFFAVVLVALASVSFSWGAVLPYSSSAMVKSERSGDNFAYSITQNQQSIAPISRALPLRAQMPVMPAGSAVYPSGILPSAPHSIAPLASVPHHQTLNYAAQPSMLMPHHVAAPALGYNPHLFMTQPQSQQVPVLHHAPQYLH